MDTRIIFATGNQDKMKEIRMILSDLGMPILSMKEAGISVDVVEDGSTFEENALIKVTEIAKHVENCIILADDSGLEIDYLNKEPGIYSARYAGVDTSYDIKNQLLLENLGIDIIKEMNGEFEVDEIIATFQNFFYQRMILDITAIKNYTDIVNLQKLSISLDMQKFWQLLLRF